MVELQILGVSLFYSCYDSCIEGSTLHKLLGILPLLAIEQRRRKKK